MGGLCSTHAEEKCARVWWGHLKERYRLNT